MEIYSYSENKIKKEYFSGCALCLGDFDGVHQGHRALFSAAGSYGKWGVLIFDRNIKNSKALTTQYEKIKLIENSGADFLIIAEFSDSFSKKTPEEFAGVLKALGISKAVAGYDYRFGYKASGDAADLKRLCKEQNIEAEIVPEFTDGTGAIKSTRIRELIKNGEIEKANELLGYRYPVSGIVEEGFKKGRSLGFPTANIAYDKNKCLPPDGVYYGKVKGLDAVINVGKNPTFPDRNRTVEVHILDYSEDLYNEFIEVEFLEKIRGEIKFENEAELAAQVRSDIRYVKGK